MTRNINIAIVLAGAALVVALALASARRTGGEFVQQLASQTDAAIVETDGSPITARFADRYGSPSRHAMLSRGDDLPDHVREQVAKAVHAIPGIGGVHWEDGTVTAGGSSEPALMGRCQDDVEALLRARSIRFEESSASIESSSALLLDEVTNALRPCTGAVVAIIGHTDKSGPEPGNIALSQERAVAVREALVARGIPRDGLRTRGVGSSEPVDGLDPADPANRRIEFDVISTEPVVPTPVDTPSAR